MKKLAVFSFLLLFIVTLSSFSITREQLVGTWRWIYIQNANTGDRTDVSKMTMGLSKDVKFQFKEDNTFVEHKSRSEDGKVSMNEGKWRLNENGTGITIEMNGRETLSEVISFKTDTLIMTLRGPMQLVMVKEK